MRTQTVQSQIRALTAYLTKRKPHRPNKDKPSWWLLSLLMAVVACVGWYSGWFAGCSRTSIATSIVPLFFGLLTAFLLSEISWPKVIATPIFLFCFVWGYDLGENIDEPMTVQDVLISRNLDVSDAVFDELTLLDALMRKQDIETRRHDAIMVSVGSRIVEDPTLAIDQQLEKLKQFREALQKLE